MMRSGTAAILVVCAGSLSLTMAAGAQSTPGGVRMAQATTDTAAAVRRPPARVRVYPRYQPEPDGVYPRYYPGPNAVRECNVTYVQEHRQSGTVIVPHMGCVWRPG